ALVAKKVPKILINEISLVVRSVSFLASCALQASQMSFSATSRASGAAFEAAVLTSPFSLIGASFLSAGFADAALGSTTGASAWKAAFHLAPSRTYTLAAQLLAGTCCPPHVPSTVVL